jgi:hypothetical protein
MTKSYSLDLRQRVARYGNHLRSFLQLDQTDDIGPAIARRGRSLSMANAVSPYDQVTDVAVSAAAVPILGEITPQQVDTKRAHRHSARVSGRHVPATASFRARL